MEITEVRVSLRSGAGRTAPEPRRALRSSPGMSAADGDGRPGSRPGDSDSRAGGETRLKAYATLTFDACFVVRNIKIIEGKSGLFVAMPSHKPKMACGRCQFKNDLGGRYCCQCGSSLSRPMERAVTLSGDPPEAQAHRDIAHPITAEFRQYLQQKVLAAYEAELARAGSAVTDRFGPASGGVPPTPEIDRRHQDRTPKGSTVRDRGGE